MTTPMASHLGHRGHLQLFSGRDKYALSRRLVLGDMSEAVASPVHSEDTSNAANQVKPGSPNDFLKSAYFGCISSYLAGVIGKKVIVRLNSGIDYHGTQLCLGELTHTGTLSCLDGYMNIAMEETTEHVDGVLKSSYGDAFIRGNNGMLIALIQSCTSPPLMPSVWVDVRTFIDSVAPCTMLWSVSTIGPSGHTGRLDELGKELAVHVSFPATYTYGATHSRAQ